MPQDPNLYGQRPSKKQKTELALPSSLAFTAQLTSLLSTGASSPTAPAKATGRPRPSKSKVDDLAGTKAKRKQPTGADGAVAKPLVLKDVLGTEDDKAERARARRKMEEKARLYAAMKRGDYVAKEGEAAPLVDFDRKWAEERGGDGNRDSSSSDYGEDDDSDGDDDALKEIVEYEDEFGRMRRGTRADKERLDRRLARGAVSAAELERMSARPKAPEKLIVGDTVQYAAFSTDDPDRMEELARRRDRSATPPDAKHYEADRDVRTKGVGFYSFSKDEAAREAEMKALEEERANTEKARREREEKKEARRKETERRRAEIAERRAMRMADSFLDDLAGKILDGDGDG